MRYLLLSSLLSMFTSCSGTAGLSGAGSSTTNSVPSSNSQFIYFGGAANTISGIKIASNAASAIEGSPFIMGEGPQFSMAAAGDLVFVSSMGDGLSSWRVDPRSGVLTRIFSLPDNVGELVLDPTGRFLYGSRDWLTYGYSIDRQAGTVAPLSDSPYLDIHELSLREISPDGTWICGGGFAGPGNGNLSCAQRDPQTGAISLSVLLTSSLDAPYGNAGFAPENSLITGIVPTGKPHGIGVFRPTTNGIQEISSVIGVGSEDGLAVSPDGNYVAVSDGQTKLVTLFTFDSAGGTLKKVASAEISSVPGPLTFSCDGHYLAVVHTLDDFASVFVASSSALHEISGSPVPVGKFSIPWAAAACPAV